MYDDKLFFHLFLSYNLNTFMSSSKTIAKNTLILYIRMFFTMAVSLYTSRVVLNNLGISDFGVYSIVGGIVSSFGFLHNAMANATQRFITFAIGENDFTKLKNIFSSSLTLHFLIAAFFLVLAETIGLWFLNYKLNIQVNRIFAANVVFQLSVFTFIVGIIQVPYNALIIAREKMIVFAYMSIIEVFLKLLIVFILPIINYDHLIVYAFLYLFASLLIRIAYKIYCSKNFKESHYEFFYDKLVFIDLLSFSGWTMFGSASLIAKGQGLNILLNLFFGTVLNAAYGITMQVQSAVQLFLQNLQVAFRPQIIINYANGNFEKFNELVFKSSKLSYFLMLLIICPIILNIDFILNLWLKNPPRYVNIFVTLSLVALLIDSLSEPLVIANQATGTIKWFQIIEGTFVILNIPISYLLLKFSRNPVDVFYVSIVINSFALFIRLILVRKLINVVLFFKTILIRVFFVSAFIILIAFLLRTNLGIAITFFDFIKQSIITFFSVLLLIYLIGLEREEKFLIHNYLKHKINFSLTNFNKKR